MNIGFYSCYSKGLVRGLAVSLPVLSTRLGGDSGLNGALARTPTARPLAPSTRPCPAAFHPPRTLQCRRQFHPKSPRTSQLPGRRPGWWDLPHFAAAGTGAPRSEATVSRPRGRVGEAGVGPRPASRGPRGPEAGPPPTEGAPEGRARTVEGRPPRNASAAQPGRPRALPGGTRDSPRDLPAPPWAVHWRLPGSAGSAHLLTFLQSLRRAPSPDDWVLALGTQCRARTVRSPPPCRAPRCPVEAPGAAPFASFRGSGN